MKKCPVCNYTPASGEKKSRSVQQNKYMWGCLIPIISEHLGYDKSETHSILKARFLSREIALDTIKGMETYLFIGDTKSLTTVEFEVYMSNIRTWASCDLGCWVPTPNETGYYDERS